MTELFLDFPQIPFLAFAWELACLNTQEVSNALLLWHRGGQQVGGGTWFSLRRKPLVQCAGNSCSGCCIALPHLPTETPDRYVLPIVHQFAAWGEGSGLRDRCWIRELSWKQMRKWQRYLNSVCFLKVLKAVIPQEDKGRRGRSHLKLVGRGHATATKWAYSSMKSFVTWKMSLVT